MSWISPIVKKVAPAVTKVVVQAGDDIAAKAAKFGIKERKLIQLQELGKIASQRTVSPERLIELYNRGIHGYYSRTVLNADGSMTKVLSNGDKVVISKNAEGRTVRQVFRSDNLMVDDTKSLSKYKVGNKTVRVKEINRNINTMYNAGQGSERRLIIPHDNAFAFNYKAERVLDKDGKLFGMRETEFFPAHYDHCGRYVPDNTYVTKTAYTGDVVTDAMGYKPSWKGYVKQFIGSNGPVADKLEQSAVNARILGGRIRDYSNPVTQTVGNKKRIVDKFYIVTKGYPGQEYVRGTTGGLGQYKPIVNSEVRNRYALGGGYASTGERLDGSRLYQPPSFNEKGLPLPFGIKVPSNEMSLKDMRLFVENNLAPKNSSEYPIRYMGLHDCGLGFLDKPYPRA